MNTFDEWNPSITEAERYFYLAAKISPSRIPGGKATENKVIGYPSRKMDLLIRCESALERIAAIGLEINPSIDAYFCQPPACNIQITKKNGKKGTVTYTPDFVYKSDNEISVIEVKSHEKVKELAISNPFEWEFDGVTAHHRSYSEYFESFGMLHSIVIPDLYGKLRMHNLRILDQSLRRTSSVSEDSIVKLLLLLKETDEITVHNALRLIDHADPVTIYQMIGKGVVITSLNNGLLEDIRSSKIRLAGADSENTELPYAPSNKSNHAYQSHFFNSSQSEIDEGIKKLKWLTANKYKAHKKHCRTVHRYRKAISDAKQRGIPSIAALAPNHSKKGNRKPKREKIVFDYLDCFVKKNWLMGRPIKKSLLYAKYYLEATNHHPLYRPIGKTSFYNKLNSIPPETVAQAHKGRRGFNAEKPPSLPENREIVSTFGLFDTTLDHHTVDCLVEISSDGYETITRKPILSILLDRGSNAVLSWHIDICEPSQSIVSILIRKTLREWGRLPVSIRTDRGSDLTSHHSEDLMAHLGIEKTLSPKSYGRGGGEVERSFSEVINDFVSGLPGYTPSIINRREMDSHKDPSNLPVLPLLNFIERFDEFIKLRNKRIHGERSQSPEQLVKSSIEKTSLAGIPYEQGFNFDLDTAINITDYSFDYRRGLHVSGRRYFSSALNNHQLDKKNTEVRIDPENPCLVYVRVNNQWTTASHRDLDAFENSSPAQQAFYNLWITGGKSIRSHAKFQAKLRTAKLLIDIESEFQNPPLEPAPLNSTEPEDYDFNFKQDPAEESTLLYLTAPGVDNEH
ncbi:DDE-type integrase/transposase/recombinase [Alcanivorax sp. VBW004]|uniref:Integrase catalytic subunit n=1 Tax=Alcanivorax jadensis T9 TaxID=1177181 RepID=A0ABR4WG41_9GAMM|nr:MULTISPECIES: TnsA endonuclease N-terminal domain-containing protein [Alcanivorax]KGD62385.1 integrase catalytic subunit [Alcanivorax jadensis T9]MTT51576.1 DDE-type integrase/transposase/recombinase [Alcanivorax sp. VBW004]